MILVIDVHNMAHRASHAHSELWSKTSGQFTGLYFGFFTMLHKLVGELKPEHVWLVSDPINAADKGCWRSQYLPEYKQRYKKRKPDEEKAYQALQNQLPELREALLRLNVIWFEQAQLEADDIIGALSQRYASTPIIAVSTDRDLFPLISPNFTVYYPGKPHRWLTHTNFTEMTTHFFKENKKLPAHEQIMLTREQWMEYRWLSGDKSDMIPGLPSCAEKRALEIIRSYGGYNAYCETIKANIAAGKKVTKTQQKLAAEPAQKVYALNAFLMRLDSPHTPVKFDMANPLCRAGVADINWLRQWMVYHDFSESEGGLLGRLQHSPLCRPISSPYDKLPSY